MSIITHLIDAAKGKHPVRTKRSPDWHRVEQEYLAEHNECEGCGRKTFLQVHHIIPFHLRPDLELKKWNLITLCEPPHRTRKCHLLLGHLGNWKWFNEDVREFADRMRAKIKEARAYRAEMTA